MELKHPASIMFQTNVRVSLVALHFVRIILQSNSTANTVNPSWHFPSMRFDFLDIISLIYVSVAVPTTHVIYSGPYRFL